jgi:hypothetical protein
VGGLKHQEKRSMDRFAGLDVSVKETSLCIVDGTGKIVREVKVASEPDARCGQYSNPNSATPAETRRQRSEIVRHPRLQGLARQRAAYAHPAARALRAAKRQLSQQQL